MLTGHGCFKAYLKRFKLTEDDKCPCDNETPQDSKHILEKCPIFAIERHKIECRMRKDDISNENVSKIWENKNASGKYIEYLEKINRKTKDMNEKI